MAQSPTSDVSHSEKNRVLLRPVADKALGDEAGRVLRCPGSRPGFLAALEHASEGCALALALLRVPSPEPQHPEAFALGLGQTED